MNKVKRHVLVFLAALTCSTALLIFMRLLSGLVPMSEYFIGFMVGACFEACLGVFERVIKK